MLQAVLEQVEYNHRISSYDRSHEQGGHHKTSAIKRWR